MLQAIVIPRTEGKPLVGWLLSDPALPHHEVRFWRALLNAPPTDEERAAIVAHAEGMERERHVRVDVLVRRKVA